MKKLIYFLSIISIVILINCKEELVKETQPVIEINKEDSTKIKINLLKEELKDSINLDSTLTNKDLFLFVIDSLYDYKYEHNYLEYNLINYKYLKSKIEIKPFNKYKIILIYYDNSHSLDHSINHIFISNDYEILENEFIVGCRYHNGKIEVKDWNKDGSDELVYQIDYPTTSVPHIQKLEDVYSFDSENGLSNIFSIVLETRDCSGTRDTLANLIRRKYTFVNDNKIKVKETDYSFDCEEFDFHGEIKNISKQKVRSYFMNWDSIENRFK